MKLEETFGVEDWKRGARQQGITLTYRVSRPLRFRMWLAVQVCRLAGWIAGVPTEEEADDSAPTREET